MIDENTDINYYKEQLEAKDDMLMRTTAFLGEIQKSLIEKNHRLSEIQKDNLDSINFAKLIQTSLAPDINVLRIFFKDADYQIVQQIGIGGDTVFIKSTNSGIVFCLLDATGHGIPGAMLSISGTLILNDITTSIEIDNPATLLKLLNYRLNKTFNHHERSIAHFEGTAFYYSSKNNVLHYSSARGKGLLINAKGEMTVLQRNRVSIGENPNTQFEKFELIVQKGEKLILFSDGLTDQFGGEDNTKYTISGLKRLLSEHFQKSASELKEIIYQEHILWKGNYQQTDDISFKVIEF